MNLNIKYFIKVPNVDFVALNLDSSYSNDV